MDQKVVSESPGVVSQLQESDFAIWGTSHSILSTKTAAGVPIEGSFTGESIPKGNQGCLVHCIRRDLGTVNWELDFLQQQA